MKTQKNKKYKDIKYKSKRKKTLSGGSFNPFNSPPPPPISRKNKPTTINNGNRIVYGANTPTYKILDLSTKLFDMNSRMAITRFQKYMVEYSRQPATRVQRYDIHFLCAIMSIIHDYNDPVNYSYKKNINSNTLIKVDANKEVNCCDENKPKDNRLLFFMEDIYTEDLNKFITEYDEFIKTKKSEFFYKSNVTNIAMLFRCYYKRCFDDYIKNQFKSKNNSVKKEELDSIWKTFNDNKKTLIKTMITAYNSCSYEAICNLYSEYLEFYSSTLGLFLITQVHSFGHFYNNVERELSNESNSNKIKDFALKKMSDDIISNIKKTKQSNSNFFIYLSCSHVSEYKQARFYMTRFIDSYIGNGFVHGEFILNTMDVIGHDFYHHGNLERITTTNPSNYDTINRNFIMTLYKKPIDVYQYGMYVLQIMQNEYEKSNPIIFNLLNFHNTFLDYKNKSSDLLTKYHSSETIEKFVRWVIPEDIKYEYKITDRGDQGFDYTIIINNNTQKLLNRPPLNIANQLIENKLLNRANQPVVEINNKPPPPISRKNYPHHLRSTNTNTNTNTKPPPPISRGNKPQYTNITNTSRFINVSHLLPPPRPPKSK